MSVRFDSCFVRSIVSQLGPEFRQVASVQLSQTFENEMVALDMLKSGAVSLLNIAPEGEKRDRVKRKIEALMQTMQESLRLVSAEKLEMAMRALTNNLRVVDLLGDFGFTCSRELHSFDYQQFYKESRELVHYILSCMPRSIQKEIQSKYDIQDIVLSPDLLIEFLLIARDYNFLASTKYLRKILSKEKYIFAGVCSTDFCTDFELFSSVRKVTFMASALRTTFFSFDCPLTDLSMVEEEVPKVLPNGFRLRDPQDEERSVKAEAKNEQSEKEEILPTSLQDRFAKVSIQPPSEIKKVACVDFHQNEYFPSAFPVEFLEKYQPVRVITNKVFCLPLKLSSCHGSTITLQSRQFCLMCEGKNVLSQNFRIPHTKGVGLADLKMAGVDLCAIKPRLIVVKKPKQTVVPSIGESSRYAVNRLGIRCLLPCPCDSSPKEWYVEAAAAPNTIPGAALICSRIFKDEIAEKGRFYLQAACAEGDPEALFEEANTVFATKPITPQAAAHGAKLIEASARGGLVRAIERRARFYAPGWPKANPDKEFRLLIKAAASGLESALFTVAEKYEKGSLPVSQDLRKAFLSYDYAAMSIMLKGLFLNDSKQKELMLKSMCKTIEIAYREGYIDWKNPEKVTQALTWIKKPLEFEKEIRNDFSHIHFHPRKGDELHLEDI